MSWTSWLYRAASVSNDVRAVTSGDPVKVVKRYGYTKPGWRYGTRVLKRLF